jgi:capsular polysaccharide biosynthesis protein
VPNLVFGALAGLLIGAGAAVLIEYFDTTLKTPDQVEKLVGYPVIGVIPVFTVKR